MKSESEVAQSCPTLATPWTSAYQVPPSMDFPGKSTGEVHVFLELSCFFYDPADAGNLISGFSAFSKTSLNIWNFTVHILLKPGLENFEHYLLACKMSAILW